MCRLYHSKARGTYTRLCYRFGACRGTHLPGDHIRAPGPGSWCVPKDPVPRRARTPWSGLPRCPLCGNRRSLSIEGICAPCGNSGNGQAYLAHRRRNRPRPLS